MKSENPAPRRRPAVAGSFYPAEQRELSNFIDDFLKKAPLLAKGNLKILLVPHAGMEYSGPVAAAGFKQIQGQNYSKVIILGASHQVSFDYAAVYDRGSWETPLGEVSINQDLAQKILDPKSGIMAETKVHAEEHSLEIELPFLQKTLAGFQIVPILLGQVREETLTALTKKIAENLDEQTLLIVSSDLSHYPSAEIAEKTDKETLKAILTGKEKVFNQTLEKISQEGYPGLVTSACGAEAIRVALKVAETLNLREIKEIKYQNSGDVTADKSRVVGYGAVGFWESQNEALAIARQTLEDHLSGRPSPSFSPLSPQLLQPLGAFVTLTKNGELRGCIGEFEPKEPLYKVIQKMAVAAATEDPRFPKVMKDELPEIKIEISIMTPRQKIDDWRKIRLGVDGVVIQYGGRSGTFLPQVATETGWSLEEFLSQLCSQKAGLPPHSYKSPEVSLYIFQVQIFKER